MYDSTHVRSLEQIHRKRKQMVGTRGRRPGGWRGSVQWGRASILQDEYVLEMDGINGGTI